VACQLQSQYLATDLLSTVRSIAEVACENYKVSRGSIQLLIMTGLLYEFVTYIYEGKSISKLKRDIELKQIRVLI
jgi:hypothetical protein